MTMSSNFAAAKTGKKIQSKKTIQVLQNEELNIKWWWHSQSSKSSWPSSKYKDRPAGETTNQLSCQQLLLHAIRGFQLEGKGWRRWKIDTLIKWRLIINDNDLTDQPPLLNATAKWERNYMCRVNSTWSCHCKIVFHDGEILHNLWF